VKKVYDGRHGIAGLGQLAIESSDRWLVSHLLDAKEGKASTAYGECFLETVKVVFRMELAKRNELKEGTS
jgi:hypothetical protein